MSYPTEPSPPSEAITMDNGVQVIDNTTTITAGLKGPMTIDIHYFQRLGHFNRENIPPRVIGANGVGAYGSFTGTIEPLIITLVTSKKIREYSCADLFSEVGKKTDILMRFSSMSGQKGTPDTQRSQKGFSIRFYTSEGNWDLVGSNIPVNSVKDPLKYMDSVHAQQPDPRNNIHSSVSQWDFWSLCPETLHHVHLFL